MGIELPTCSTVGSRSMAEDFLEGLCRQIQLSTGPLLILVGNIILPAHMIVTVDANLVTRLGHRAHHITRFTADMRSG